MSELLDAFNKVKAKMANRLIEGMLFPDVAARVHCPCCGTDRVVLVDVAVEAATGREVKVGDTHQCENCLAYFVPGEPCEDAEHVD